MRLEAWGWTLSRNRQRIKGAQLQTWDITREKDEFGICKLSIPEKVRKSHGLWKGSQVFRCMFSDRMNVWFLSEIGWNRNIKFCERSYHVRFEIVHEDRWKVWYCIVCSKLYLSIEGFLGCTQVCVVMQNGASRLGLLK